MANLAQENAELKEKLHRAEMELENRRLKDELCDAAERFGTVDATRTAAAQEHEKLLAQLSTEDIGNVDDVVFVAKQEFRISKRDKTPSAWPKFAVGDRVARLQLPAGCELKRFIRDTRDRFIGDGPDPIYPPKQ